MDAFALWASSLLLRNYSAQTLAQIWNATCSFVCMTVTSNCPSREEWGITDDMQPLEKKIEWRNSSNIDSGKIFRLCLWVKTNKIQKRLYGVLTSAKERIRKLETHRRIHIWIGKSRDRSKISLFIVFYIVWIVALLLLKRERWEERS